MPQLRGRPIARPEPAVTSGSSRTAAPRRSRSSLETASAMAIPTPSSRRASKRARIASAPPATAVWSTRPTGARGLRAEDGDEVGVGHRRERVVAHAALAEQHVADEEMALEDRAPVVGERRRRDREVGAERVHQRLGDRADVAGRCRVEGRAVLEVDLLGALRPAARRAPASDCLDGLGRRDGARLERDDHGVRVHASPCPCRVGVRLDVGVGRPSTAGGTSIICTTRMPARTRLLARSVAPVKSSAMQPSRIPMLSHLRLGQVDAREDLDHRAVVLLRAARRRRLHEHLVRGGRQRQRELARRARCRAPARGP